MIEHSKYDAVVFDWDGTMMDTTALIVKSIQHAAREMGIPVPSDEVASSIIGLDWRNALRIAVPDLLDGARDEFGEHYQATTSRTKSASFSSPDGRTREGTQGLSVAVAVATGKSYRGFEPHPGRRASPTSSSTKTATNARRSPTPRYSKRSRSRPGSTSPAW